MHGQYGPVGAQPQADQPVVSVIEAGPVGEFTPASVRAFLQQARVQYGTSFALLGGDTPWVPTRWAWAMDCEAGFAADENEIHTDLYFSDLDGTWKPYKAVGCSACSNGYKGRVGLYQVMPITEPIQRIILSEGTALDIAKQAESEGVRDLRQSGLVKVRAGVTSLEEVITVTNE